MSNSEGLKLEMRRASFGPRTELVRVDVGDFRAKKDNLR